MDLGAAGLNEQPFPSHGKPVAVVSYEAEQSAIEALGDTYAHISGLCLFQGPALSGKSTIIERFITTLHEDCAVAIVDGGGLDTSELLLAILRQFGFKLETTSVNELLGLLRVFTAQQASLHEPPLLIIENTQEMNPATLHTLGELAELRVRTGSALKIVLVSARSLAGIMRAAGMEPVVRRKLHDFHLRPMAQQEAQRFLYAKLRAAGSECPEFIFPDAVCDELWRASGGWPGILDRIALLALASVETLPVSVDHIEHPALPVGTWNEAELVLVKHEIPASKELPRVIVTNNGSVIGELAIAKPRLLIGRSDHNDVSIGSRFISRHHAMLVRHGSSTILMDLNSTNGTYVNSRRVSIHILNHDDVITVGHHKIKFHDPTAQPRDQLDPAEFSDTVIMKTLDDMRNLLSQENTAELPAISEDMPTIQS